MMPEPHTHLIIHFCSDQQDYGIQGGECATPEACLRGQPKAITDQLVTFLLPFLHGTEGYGPETRYGQIWAYLRSIGKAGPAPSAGDLRREARR